MHCLLLSQICYPEAEVLSSYFLPKPLETLETEFQRAHLLEYSPADGDVILHKVSSFVALRSQLMLSWAYAGRLALRQGEVNFPKISSFEDNAFYRSYEVCYHLRQRIAIVGSL
jgi:hypothetical protein